MTALRKPSGNPGAGSPPGRIAAALRRTTPAAWLGFAIIALYAATALFAPLIADPSEVVRFLTIFAVAIVGVMLFVLFCQLTGVVDFRRVFSAVRRRGA